MKRTSSFVFLCPLIVLFGLAGACSRTTPSATDAFEAPAHQPTGQNIDECPAASGPATVLNEAHIDWEFFGPSGQSRDVAVQRNGDILLAGQTGPSLLTIALDPGGRQKNLLPLSTPATIYAATATDDSGYVLAGSRNGRAQAHKIDAGGNVQWTYQSLTNETIAFSVVRSRMTGYFLAGQVGQGEMSDIWAAKLSEEGASEWEIQLGSDKADAALVVTALSGGPVLSGYTSGPERKMWVMKLGHGGEVLWTSTLPGSRPMAIKAATRSTMGILLAGAGTEGGTHIVKIDGNGDTLWQRDHPDIQIGNTLRSLVALGNGYLLAGDIGGHAGAIAFNRRGCETWRLQTKNSSIARSAIATGRGHILLTGDTVAGAIWAAAIRIPATLPSPFIE